MKMSYNDGFVIRTQHRISLTAIWTLIINYTQSYYGCPKKLDWHFEKVTFMLMKMKLVSVTEYS